MISGFGGQGVLTMGKVIALAGMREGKEVSWMPAYGPEQRGGTANVTVIVSDEGRISSPVLSNYTTAILLNQPSVDKFDRTVLPGGYILYEEESVLTPPQGIDGVKVMPIRAMATAAEVGEPRILNMVVLGAYLAVRPIIGVDTVMNALKEIIPARHHDKLPLNEQAIRAGMALIK